MSKLTEKFMGFLGWHPLFTFFWMGVFFLFFALSSFNLVMIFHANFELISEHGYIALRDGALQQFFELLVYGYLSLCFYVLFKICESILVSRFLKKLGYQK